ncbi:MAG: glycosyl hydrolase [Monoraphidium minutum]|nr:MAG: glycosyl hydrolase [Monoraphidium minutum]
MLGVPCRSAWCARPRALARSQGGRSHAPQHAVEPLRVRRGRRAVSRSVSGQRSSLGPAPAANGFPQPPRLRRRSPHHHRAPCLRAPHPSPSAACRSSVRPWSSSRPTRPRPPRSLRRQRCHSRPPPPPSACGGSRSTRRRPRPPPPAAPLPRPPPSSPPPRRRRRRARRPPRCRARQRWRHSATSTTTARGQSRTPRRRAAGRPTRAGPSSTAAATTCFFQHLRDSVQWHWGLCWDHVVSEDLVHWRKLPPAIAPTPAWFDADGCFSGAAELDPETGAPVLLYTGVYLRSNAAAGAALGLPGGGRALPTRFVETQLAAVPADPDDPDLTYWRKLPEPVIRYPPPNLGLSCWRDPFILREGGEFVMLLASGFVGAGGAIITFRSKSLTRGWRYAGVLAASGGSLNHWGKDWECPILAELPDLEEAPAAAPGAPAGGGAAEGAAVLTQGAEAAAAAGFCAAAASCAREGAAARRRASGSCLAAGSRAGAAPRCCRSTGGRGSWRWRLTARCQPRMSHTPMSRSPPTGASAAACTTCGAASRSCCARCWTGRCSRCSPAAARRTSSTAAGSACTPRCWRAPAPTSDEISLQARPAAPRAKTRGAACLALRGAGTYRLWGVWLVARGAFLRRLQLDGALRCAPYLVMCPPR